MKLRWFKHDTDASSDAKIKRLLLRHGAEGYAIYFHCIELIAGNIDENNITFELEHDAEIIADNLKIRGEHDISAIDKVNIIMKTIIELGLFEESNSRIFCTKLAKRLDQSMTSNSEMRKLIHNAKSHDNVMTMSCQRHERREEIRRDKIREDKNRKDKKIFKKPTHEEINKYLKERKITTFCAEQFFDHYESVGWVIGKNKKMKDWKAAVRTWERSEYNEKPKPKYKIIEGNMYD